MEHSSVSSLLNDTSFMMELGKCNVIPPAAVSPMTVINADVQVFGLNPEADVRLLLHQNSTVLVNRVINSSEITSEKILLKLPPLSEGVVTFTLISEMDGLETILDSVPCCVVPSEVVKDITQMLQTMLSISDEDLNLPSHVTNEKQRFIWIWTNHFCMFLEDFERLVQWFQSSTNQESPILELFTNMFQQICEYNAYELAAYMICKAIEQGVKIRPNPFHGVNTITAETLKATLFSCSSMCDGGTSTTAHNIEEDM